MFKKLFKKEAILSPRGIKVLEKVITKNKTESQLIEEIHESFFTEVDNLLKSAKITNSLETDKSELINKCERLKKLGFTNSKEVNEAQIEIKRLRVLEEDNKSKSKLIEVINYFSFKYPNYKFITEDSVKKICKKYGLIYGTIDRYIGTVPDKNIKHIEDFKVEDADSIMGYWNRNWNSKFIEVPFYQIQDAKNRIKEVNDQILNLHSYEYRKHYIDIANAIKASLEIAAPIKDFNTQGMELKDFNLKAVVNKDPIVLHPVTFNNQKYYLIVTAWGLEGSDELVVNNKMN